MGLEDRKLHRRLEFPDKSLEKWPAKSHWTRGIERSHVKVEAGSWIHYGWEACYEVWVNVKLTWPEAWREAPSPSTAKTLLFFI